MDDWKGRNEWRTDEYLPHAVMNIEMNDEWRNESEKDVWNEYLPRAVMNIEMNDECRNECEKMLKERMITDLVWNEYLPRDVMTIEMNDEWRNDRKGRNDC